MDDTYLVLANGTLGSPVLDRQLIDLHEAGPARFRILVPLEGGASRAVAHSENLRWTGESPAVTAARLRLRRGMDRLQRHGLTVTGDLSHGDPISAAVEAFARGRVDGIVVSTLDRRASRWMRLDVPARLRRRFDVPIIHVETAIHLDRA